MNLHSPHFDFALATDNGLRAASLTNRLTGRVLPLDLGPELEVELDAAHRRLWIEGWRMTTAENRFCHNFHRPEFDDSKWTTHPTPNQTGWRTAPGTWFWARTHLFVPDDCRNQPLTLMLGGYGITDFRFMRVYVNGKLVGTRQTKTRWFEPGQFNIRRVARFGQDNVIALQLTNPFWRTQPLDEQDPRAAHCLPVQRLYSSPYMQCVVAGTPFVQPQFVVESSDPVKLTAVSSSLSAEVKYETCDAGRVLRKSTRLTNHGSTPVRLLRVGLGVYHTDAAVTDGEVGFPVYADNEFFFSLDHPAGWAMGERGTIRLCQFPGIQLQPGQSFDCMNVVLGVAEQGRAREAFRAHLSRQMRRVVRQHDQPRSVFEFFGAWDRGPKEPFLSEEPTEKFSRHVVRQLADFHKQTGQQFDTLSFEFWSERKGDLTQFKSQNFPHGFSQLKKELKAIHVEPGLWFDVAWGPWGNGENPVVQSSRSDHPAYPTYGLALCSATDPFRAMLTNACRHHIRENGARLFKFDSFRTVCNSTHHEHLPGLYSIEAICSAMIERLRALDTECADVFLMTYWGFSSPWWLLHADTIFESGLFMEGSSPGPTPTLYARDGVSVGLDQGNAWAGDIPPLAKDSLGVWCSDWPWNSMLGKERWQEAFVLDLCRGSLLAQFWSDQNFLSRTERAQLATFLELLKTQPACFANSRLSGDPWLTAPYGYYCSDSQRAFVALHNATWSDQRVPLESHLSPPWDVYRWYPHPARLTGAGRVIALRPFEVVLLEIVPAGIPPTLNRIFKTAPLPTGFIEPSRALPVQTRRSSRQTSALRIALPATTRGGTLVIAAERTSNGRAFQTHFVGTELELRTTLKATPVLGRHTYPCAWQAWRIPISRAGGTTVTARLIARASEPHRVSCRAYFIPND